LLLLLLSLCGGPQMKKFIAKKMKQQHLSLLLFSLQVSQGCVPVMPMCFFLGKEKRLLSAWLQVGIA
jgi:hypothetical protein